MERVEEMRWVSVPEGRAKRLRCVVLDDVLRVAAQCAEWSALNQQLELEFQHQHFENTEQLVVSLQGAHIVVLMRERTALPAEVIDRLKDLQLIVTAGHRNGALDVEAAARRGIPVLGTPILVAPAMELTWALILALARQVPRETAALRTSSQWQCGLGVDLKGSTLGLVGLGRLGASVSAVARAFGMRVLAWSHNLDETRCQSLDVELAPSLDALMRESDFVSIHSVLSERTHHLISYEQIAAMKCSAFLINTSRAAIVDEAALLAALQTRRIAGAGLDVFEHEPLPTLHPYRTLSNVIATPHIGYVTWNMYRLIYRSVVENLQAWLEGRLLREVLIPHPAHELNEPRRS